MEFSRQAYWSGLPFPSQGIFPTQRSSLGLLHCRQIPHHLSRRWKGSLKMCIALVLLLLYVK